MPKWPIYFSIACSAMASFLLSSDIHKQPAFYHAFECIAKLDAPVLVEIGSSTPLVAEWVKNHSNCEYSLVEEDASTFLRHFDLPIDFLYVHTTDMKEIANACRNLAKDAIVMIEGNAKAEQHLIRRGYKIVIRGEQTLLSRAGSDLSKVRFNEIYEKKGWGTFYDDQENAHKGSSGSGARPDNAKVYLEFLEKFLKENPIQSVVEVGCGDWQLSGTIDWQGIDYLGIDVVPSLIDHHNEHFKASNIHFLEADGTRIELPPADLLICKDVLQHLPDVDIHRFLKQLSKYKYAILVNDVDPKTLSSKNTDIPVGGGRTVDLSVAPFYLPGEKVAHYKCIYGEAKVIFLWTNR